MSPDKTIMNEKKYPYFIELVGLAGAGKSTLAAALSEQMEKVEPLFPPDLHAARDIPFFLWNSIKMLPTFFAILRENGGRLPSRHEMALMVMLNGWPDRLSAEPKKDCTATLVDQGPISFLGMLERISAPWQNTPTGKKWLESIFQRWSKVISLVIMLDADNEVLLSRIRSRAQEHRLKTATDEDAINTLELYRKIYPKVINCLQTETADIKVLSYNSTQVVKEALHSHISADVEHALGIACKGTTE